MKAERLTEVEKELENPKIWDDPKSLDYLRASYETLAAFFHTAAAAGDSVLIWMS